MNKKEPEQNHPRAGQDPICGMEPSPDTPHRTTYRGQEYLFCSAACLARFQENPEHFAGTGGDAAGPQETKAAPAESKPDQTAKRLDPVCGMLVQPDSPFQAAYEGRDFAFCCRRCLELFHSDPERYLRPAAVAPPPAEPEKPAPPGTYYTCPMDPEVRQDEPGACPKCGMALERAEPEAPLTRTEWTCPMHPEVVQDSPGSCPKCGMALEPRTIYAEEEENPELVDMRRRFWVSSWSSPSPWWSLPWAA
jgi:P-type Cu+ transporter